MPDALTNAPLTPDRVRAKRRLQALGVDPDAMDHEQIRRLWESVRAAYINNATAGLHFNPMNLDGDPFPGACLHARVGFLTDALKTWYGQWPQGWSHHRITWPGPGETPPGTVTVTAAQAQPRELPQ